MIAPDMPANEAARQEVVERYNLLDTLPEENYDNITALIAHVASAPVSLITMLDKGRNFLKSHHGVPFNESPREISFCGHAINAKEDITVIEDATQDERFYDNPLVTDGGVRFYAGVPLVTPDQYRVGTLCIFDIKPRELQDDVRKYLINMAQQVETILEHRYQNQILINYRKQLEVRNIELESFAKVAAHDIKILMISHLYSAQSLAEGYSEHLPPSAVEKINRIVTSSTSACKYIDTILDYYTSDRILSSGKDQVDLESIFNEVSKLTATVKNSVMTTSGLSEVSVIHINRGALIQILLNLVTNSMKFCDKDPAKIHIEFQDNKKHYKFTVTDNGIGIPASEFDTIFELFSQGTFNADSGSGLGLALVKKLVERMGGEINVQSSEGNGACFTFTVPKQVANFIEVQVPQS